MLTQLNQSQVFAAVLELDEFLRDEEEALREQQAKVMMVAIDSQES